MTTLSAKNTVRGTAAPVPGIGLVGPCVTLGHEVGNGLPVNLDIMGLIDSRGLAQANSGGGKSWLLRLIAEQAAPHVQTIVLDPEGEFSTLREKLDIVLVAADAGGAGSSAEVKANPTTAALLARRLVEINASAVVDLYGLEVPDRRRMVRLFLDGLTDLPRKLWRPLLVILDEAHLFCPERSSGEAESTNSVIRFMSLGRKRGFCGLLATQRLSKLHKDAVAECNNIFIGRTSLDSDQKRAGDVLGMSPAARVQLRALPQGTWHAYGPAIEFHGVAHFRADPVQTTHPRPGSRHLMKAPAPSAVIARLLPELADLAEHRDPDDPSTVDEAREIIARLKAQGTEGPPGGRDAGTEGNAQAQVDPAEQERAISDAVALARSGRDAAWQELTERRSEAVRAACTDLRAAIEAVSHGLQVMEAAVARTVEAPLVEAGGQVEGSWRTIKINDPPDEPITTEVWERKPAPSSEIKNQKSQITNASSAALAGAARKLLTAIAQRNPRPSTRAQVSLLSGYSITSSSFKNALSELRVSGRIVDEGGSGGGGGGRGRGRGGAMRITPKGLSDLGLFERMPPGRRQIEWWLAKLGKAEGTFLKILTDAYPRWLTKDQVSAASGYSKTSSSFKNALSTLRVGQLVQADREGRHRASENFFQ